ncbi:protein kinase domain-containing protein [Heyndrickxia acidicola]|uniref:Protein kinase n=1 Tax=Heyndrickxia acidicola TaxID=209389 RepID=A0ABU6MSI6_9BACI|nr:protein kinase [Heyndrickxia acidicola]MED1205995.1 protein kinase [Heyndrickxia acidicola]
MMNNTLRTQFNFSPGTIVNGKWHKNRYKLIKELGAGANGIVYLAEGSKGYVALKMSDNSASVTSEVNVLKAFSKVQGKSLGPSLLEMDDWEAGNKIVPFYIMEYIHGLDLLSFIRKKGQSWTGVLIVQLLNDLHLLHKEGWVFGDLKPENLIVTGPPAKIRYIDVGGTTKQGRAIKEFTEFFDRGYWGAGTRKADPQYDLFAVSMVVVNLAYPKRLTKSGDYKVQISNAIKQHSEIKHLEPVLMKAIMGRYSSAMEMKKDLLGILTKSGISDSRTLNKVVQPPKPRASVSTGMASRSDAVRQKKRKRKKMIGLVETLMIIVVVSILYALYIYRQVL